jgi:hypothetical protein
MKMMRARMKLCRGIRAEPSRRAGGQVRWSYEEGSGPSRAEEPEAKSREQPPTFCSPTPHLSNLPFFLGMGNPLSESRNRWWPYEIQAYMVCLSY